MTDRQALLAVIKAWEFLPTGHHSAKKVGDWLRDVMAPAINQAREVVKSEESETRVGVAYGPHGTPTHRCTPFCEDYGPPRCENGTEHCTGRGEKHACDVRTAR